MPWTTIGAAVLPSLVGGIFQSRENRRNRKAAQEAVGIDYQKLRDDASAAGFNPLTALLAGGGQGYERQFQPSLSAGSFIAEAMQRGVDTYFDVRGQQQDQEVASLRKMLEKSQAAQTAAASQPPGQFGYHLQSVEPFRPAVSVGMPALGRPQTRPWGQRQWVLDPGGRPVQMLVDQAERLGIPPMGTLMSGEMSETIGEHFEAEALADTGSIRRHTFGSNTAVGIPAQLRRLGQSIGIRLSAPELPPVGSDHGYQWHNPGGFISGPRW